MSRFFQFGLLMLIIGFNMLTPMSYANIHEGNPDVQAVAADADAFALDLYSQLAPTQGNLFFSPYSISSALAMTYGGARGDTAKQMADVLHFTLPPEKLHAPYGQLIASLNNPGTVGDAPTYELAIANALWGQKGYPYQPSFLEMVRKNYQAGLHEVDYLHATDASRAEINKWVEKQTKDRIKDLLGPGTVTDATRLVLVNAIYFKATWAEQFYKHNTHDVPFHVDAATTVTVPLMNQGHSFNYAETDDLQIVELPYQGWKLSMFVLLPKKVDGLSRLEKQLTTKSLDEWLAKLAGRPVDLSLPKFTMTRDFQLSKELKAMGMRQAFSDKADFTGIASPEPLQISEVIHKAFVDVNEVGTEAAAATAVTMMAGSARQMTPPAVFRADHPFIFFIRDRESKAIVFMGRVVNPKG